MKSQSSFWRTQVTQVQNERFRSTVWNRIAVLDSSFPFVLPSGTSPVSPFYLYSLSQTRNNLLLPLPGCLSISCLPLHPHLTSAFRLFPPIPPACHYQLGVLKIELLTFYSLCSNTFGVCPLLTWFNANFHPECPESSQTPEICEVPISSLANMYCSVLGTGQGIRTSEHFSPLSFL